MSTIALRRSAAIGLAAFLAGCAAPSVETATPRALTAEHYSTDFDTLWSFVHEKYAYFDAKQTDWERVRELYRPRAGQVGSRREFVGLLEELLAELYDSHAHLAVNTPTSPRLIPSGTDLRAEWRGERAIISDVRGGSAAEAAGLRAGMEVLTVDDRPVRDAARARLPTSLRAADPAAWQWALQAVLAGRHHEPIRLEAALAGERRRFQFSPARLERQSALLTASRIENRFGYIRIHDSLGDTALISAFDSALVALKHTEGLVLDLRDTPGGGTSTVGRAIMSRLVADEQPYQRHELAAEERRFGVRRFWVEYVAPRGPFTYAAPVVVLVGAWTGSMGEGLAIGLDATGRATIVGRPMAGLLGAVYETRLPHTGFVVRIPAERLFHVRGTPREDFVPAVLVGGPGEEDALAAALRILQQARRQR